VELTGSFVNDKISGKGLMLTEDDSCYEGDFSPGAQLNGKGVLTLASGDQIEGTFHGDWNEGIKVNGIFRKAL
jgi:amyotrophic lateral sclerosis 2 protein